MMRLLKNKVSDDAFALFLTRDENIMKAILMSVRMNP